MVWFYNANYKLVLFDYTVPLFLMGCFAVTFLWVWVCDRYYKLFLSLLPLSGIIGMVIASSFFYEATEIVFVSVVFITTIFIPFFILKISNIKPVAVFYGILLLALGVDAVIKIYNEKSFKSQYIKNFDINQYQHTFTTKHNVYYLLADGYSSYKTLLNEDKIDNGEIYNWLENKGFSVYKNAFSNYPKSYSSMEATFNMKHHYLKDFSPISTQGYNSYLVMAGYNNVVKEFYNNNYDIYHGHMGKFENKSYETYDHGGTVDLYWLFSATRTYIIFKHFMPKKASSYITDLFTKTVVLNSKKPIYQYIHGNLLISQQFQGDDYGMVAGYKKALHYTNKDIKGVVDKILSKDPNAIIILQSDHGSVARYEWGDGSTEYDMKGNFTQKYFGIFFAVKWPSECAYLGQETYTPVNLFPRVFACLSGEKPNYDTMAADDGYIFKDWLPNDNIKPDDKFAVKVIENQKIIR